MKFIVLGAGGVGSYFAAKLLQAGHELVLVARGEHLEALQTEGLHVLHPQCSFCAPVNAIALEGLTRLDPFEYDAILLLTKSTATREIAQFLASWLKKQIRPPYIVSLQNGVENEAILCDYFAEEYVIGGLTRKIGAHIVAPGRIEAIGPAETIVGTIRSTAENELFIEHLAQAFSEAGILTQTTYDIMQELWKKLIINNGVNALCALLEVKTGTLFDDTKLASLVYGLMQETAHAARSLHVKISQQDVDAMFELIKGFDSIKPSMLVDFEHRRSLEIDEICGVVIRALHQIGVDAPYTKTISSLLEFKMERCYGKD
jgi:2-dehydropantoate 2-reductase